MSRLELATRLLPCALVLLATGGCSTPPAAIPMAESTPPRIVINDAGERVWDRPDAFERVPSSLKPTGNAACAEVDQGKAIGYHPYARDVDGSQLVGGGYFCRD